MFARRVVWLCVLAGCAGEPADPPTQLTQALPVPPAVTTGPATLPSPPAEESIRVQMLDAGREPRAPLRYRAVVGAEQTIVLDSRLDMSLSSDGHLMFGQANNSKGKIVLRVEKVEAERITLGLTVINMEMPSYDPTDFSKPDTIKGQGGTITITDRGKLVDKNLPFLETNDNAREWLQLADFLVRLPDEPVGPGARWQVHSLSQRNGIGLRAVETHEVVELAPSIVRTRWTTEQDSWPQLASFAEDPITVFEVSTFKSTGSGEMTVGFDRVMPLDARTQFEFVTDMAIRRPDGMSQAVTMTMKADMRSTTEGHGGRPR